MIVKNLRPVKFLTASRFHFSGKETQWLDSPFITRPEVPTYFRVWMDISQLHERPEPQQNYSEALNKSMHEASHNFVANEDGVMCSVDANESTNIPQQSHAKDKPNSRGRRRTRKVNTQPFKK